MCGGTVGSSGFGRAGLMLLFIWFGEAIVGKLDYVKGIYCLLTIEMITMTQSGTPHVRPSGRGV